MAEGLGVATSVIVVIELLAKCLEYSSNVKDVQEDISQLQRETTNLHFIYKNVQDLINGSHR